MEWEKGLTFALAKRKRGGARAANETESGALKKLSKTFGSLEIKVLTLHSPSNGRQVRKRTLK